jgi:hypothetical protein
MTPKFDRYISLLSSNNSILNYCAEGGLSGDPPILDNLIDPKLGIMSELEEALYGITPDTNITAMMYTDREVINHPQYGDVYSTLELMRILNTHVATNARLFNTWPVPAVERFVEQLKGDTGKEYYTWE